MNPSGSTHENDNLFVAEAVHAHQAQLLRYATRLMGGDVERARDVVQDSFVKFMAQPKDSVAGHEVEWLYRVCRNRAYDVLRKEGRMRAFAEGEVERVQAELPRPGRQLEATETKAQVLALIDSLPPKQQEVIRLKFQSGFSYKEISRITELTVGNVGFLIHTAVKRLKQEMAATKA